MTDADPPTDAAGPSSASKIAAEAAAPGVRRRRTPLTLVSELTGSLPCVRCSYDLKGLSILALCPECGTPIRATLLAVVDPKAGELQPIYHPRITATGLVAWSTAALLSLLCGWGVLLTEALPSGEIDRYLPALRYVSLILLVVSGAGAAVLINPHRHIPELSRRQALWGTIAYVPLIGLSGWLLLGRWPVESSNNLGQWAATSDSRTVVQLAVVVVTIAVILLLRPNARLLAARSVLLREGRVDRQHLLALASVLAFAVIGESITLIGVSVQAGETAVLIGRFLVMIAGVLFTLGLIGVVVDCWRIRRVVLQPPLSLESLIRASEGPSETMPTP